MTLYIYGPKFRKIRRAKHISEEKAIEVANISRATLERWERGERDLALEKVIKLLKLVHVQQSEFLQDDVLEQLKIITNDVAHQYATNNLQLLKKNINFFSQQPDQISFYYTIISANYYLDLTGTNLLTEIEINKLFSSFKTILNGNENWNNIDIFLFGNSQALLNSRTIYNLFFSLTYFFKSNLSYNKKLDSMILNTLLNAEFTLIKTDFNRAKKANNLLKRIKLSDIFAFEKIRMKLFDSLIFYIQTKDDSQIKENMVILKYENLNELSEGFCTAIKQIKQIYDHI